MKQDIAGQGKGYQTEANYIGQVGDRTYNYGGQEITVSGVGEPPPNYADYWVDRISYESQLRDRLTTSPVTQIVADGGFGKSSLAAWAFDRVMFDKRVWVCFRREHSFDRFARYVLQELGRPVKDPQANEDLLLRELVLRLNDPNGSVKMVVMDQVENAIGQSDWQWYESFLSQWAEEGRRSAVLVTSRSSVLSTSPIALAGLTEAEGIAFFDREGVTGEGRSELITLASGHPLLLKLAAAWAKETYGARVDDRAIDFFGKLFTNYAGDPTAEVSAIFDVVFEALPIVLQQTLAKLSVYRLPIGLEMAQAIETKTEFEDLELLVSRGLLLLQDDRFVLHPLVESLVRSKLTEDDRTVAHEAAIKFYEVNYQEWDGTIESCREELEIFYHACEFGQYGRANTELDDCENVLYQMGYYREILPLYVRLVGEWVPDNEAEKKELGWVLIQLGELYDKLAQYQQALTAHEKAQIIFEQLNYPEGIAASLGSQGNLYISLRKFQKAIDLQQQSLKLNRELENHEGEADALCDLGNAYQSLGEQQCEMGNNECRRQCFKAIERTFR